MRAFVRVKNFERFQHYRDRSPPWIKLYNDLLDDYEFGLLQDASKMHLVAIWLLASRSDNRVPADPAWISKRINATDHVDLSRLVSAGFIDIVDEDNQPLPIAEHPASKSLQDFQVSDHQEGEERRGEERQRRDMSGSPPATADVLQIPTVLRRTDPKALRAEMREKAKTLLAYLNERAGKNFHPTQTNLDFIIARMVDGASEQDCRDVICDRVAAWVSDSKMREYLRPETLFNRTKFNSYLGNLGTMPASTGNQAPNPFAGGV